MQGGNSLQCYLCLIGCFTLAALGDKMEKRFKNRAWYVSYTCWLFPFCQFLFTPQTGTTRHAAPLSVSHIYKYKRTRTDDFGWKFLLYLSFLFLVFTLSIKPRSQSFSSCSFHLNPSTFNSIHRSFPFLDYYLCICLTLFNSWQCCNCFLLVF